MVQRGDGARFDGNARCSLSLSKLTKRCCSKGKVGTVGHGNVCYLVSHKKWTRKNNTCSVHLAEKEAGGNAVTQSCTQSQIPIV